MEMRTTSIFSLQEVLRRLRVFCRIYGLGLLVVGIFFSIFLLVNDIKSDDYGTYLEYAHTDSILNFTVERYKIWTSRFLIEFLLTFLTAHVYIYIIITILLAMLIVYSISKCLKFSLTYQVLIVATFFCMLIPSSIYLGAGIYATTITYLWTSALLLYSFTLVPECFTRNNPKLSVRKVILCVLSLIFACNMELMAIIASIIFFGANLLLYYLHKKVHFYLILGTVISFLGCMNLLICPGNKNRSRTSMQLYFPNFSNLSVKQKINMEFLHISKCFLLPLNCILLVLVIMLLLLALKSKLSIERKVITMLCTAIVLINSGLLSFPAGYFTTQIKNQLLNDGTTNDFVPKTTFHDISTFIPHFYFLLLYICIILPICLIYGKTLKTLVILYVAFSGFFASFTLAFSPTIYMSGDRTQYPLYLALIFVVCIITTDLINLKESDLHKKLAF
ncbi:MAG: DUF6056 family protein [Candidatus Ancillula sp.]|jgi:hypothetical protein|nr:DUF6056 family protein [Candidatus Ancillula sp.]